MVDALSGTIEPFQKHMTAPEKAPIEPPAPVVWLSVPMGDDVAGNGYPAPLVRIEELIENGYRIAAVLADPTTLHHARFVLVHRSAEA